MRKLQRAEFRVLRERVPAKLSTLQASRAYVSRLVSAMVELQQSGSNDGIFAFTAPSPGAGVTTVVRLAAEALTRQTGERVLIANSSSIESPRSRQAGRRSQAAMEIAPGIWAAMQDVDIDAFPSGELDKVVVDVFEKSFGFILIDCPAVTESADVALIASQVDGVFLVVEAGTSRRDEIRHARMIIEEASGLLAGLVLNKRTYPVPESIFKFLR